MPNHVTTTLNARPEIINSLLNEDNNVDFLKISPYPKNFSYNHNGVYCNAEDLATMFFKFEKEEHPLLLSFQINKERELFDKMPNDLKPFIHDIERLEEKQFEGFLELIETNRENLFPDRHYQDAYYQFVDMLKNKYHTGYYNTISFQREEWGTKWNAYQEEFIDDENIKFQTAWKTPYPIIVKLSKKYPEDIIKVSYANEDIGSSCGYFEMKDGKEITEKSDHAPSYDKATEEEKVKWRKFAFQLIHPDSDPKDWDMNENFEYIEEDNTDSESSVNLNDDLDDEDDEYYEDDEDYEDFSDDDDSLILN